jgi:hypothetical protein
MKMSPQSIRRNRIISILSSAHILCEFITAVDCSGNNSNSLTRRLRPFLQCSSGCETQLTHVVCYANA